MEQIFQHILEQVFQPKPSYDLFRASCPPPFQGQHRFALLFKFAPGEFVSVASTRITHQPGVIVCMDALMPRRHDCRMQEVERLRRQSRGVERGHLANSCNIRVMAPWSVKSHKDNN